MSCLCSLDLWNSAPAVPGVLVKQFLLPKVGGFRGESAQLFGSVGNCLNSEHGSQEYCARIKKEKLL